jgi:hypothetical protein
VSLSVVLYAEGPAEVSGPIGLRLAPGEALDDGQLGPAHWLVRRAISRHGQMPEAAVRFQAPLNLRTGRRPTGSDLHDGTKVRTLLIWPKDAPQLAVVLIDEDGEKWRRRTLEEATADIPVPRVIGLCVREFETWLIADANAVREVTGHTGDVHPQPDLLEPRRAKELLDDWLGRGGSDRRSVRLRLARECSLDALVRLEAFQQFTDDLRRVLSASAR